MKIIIKFGRMALVMALICLGWKAAGSSSQVYDLDDEAYIKVCWNCTVELVITSSPNNGYVWYAFSEDQTKFLIQDSDGEFISCDGSSGFQKFVASCTQHAAVGDLINLSLVLKKPWNEDPTIINLVTVEVVQELY